MSGGESDPEVQFNILGGAGEGDTNNAEYKQTGEDDDAGSVYADSVSQTSSPSVSRASTPPPTLHQSENRNNTTATDRQREERLDRPPVPRLDRPPMPGLQHHHECSGTSRWKGPNLKPDTYKGEDDWEAYITHFEVCAELGRWSQKEMALSLAASLRGQARTFYMNLNSRERSSYRVLVMKLSQRFGNTNQQTVWLSRLESRQRKQGETIASFGDDVLQLVQRAHPDLHEYALEAIALNQLYKSVSPEMKYRCIIAECKTVAHAVEMIDTYDNIVQGDGDKKKSKIRAVSVEEKEKSEVTKLTEVIQELKGRINQLERGQRQGYAPNDVRRCFLCQSSDHLMRFCPMNKNRYNGRRNNPPPPRQALLVAHLRNESTRKTSCHRPWRPWVDG